MLTLHIYNTSKSDVHSIVLMQVYVVCAIKSNADIDLLWSQLILFYHCLFKILP